MKILIAYYSYSGNNEKLGLYLKNKLNCSIHKIDEIKKRKTISILLDFLLNRNTRMSPYSVDLAEYDFIIFISPVWGSKIATPLRMFINKEKNKIKHYAFISLCNGEENQEEKLISELTSLILKDPIICSQLSINHLLPVEKQNKIKHTFNFKVTDEALDQFSIVVDDFIDKVISKKNV